MFAKNLMCKLFIPEVLMINPEVLRVQERKIKKTKECDCGQMKLQCIRGKYFIRSTAFLLFCSLFILRGV